MTTKSLFLLIAFFTLNLTTTIAQSSYGDISFNEAVNISGRQRMLTQKMSKNYLLLVKTPSNTSFKTELNESKSLFESQLSTLRKNAPSASNKSLIEKIDNLWNTFKGLTEDLPANTKSAKSIMDLNTGLLKACNDLVVDIESNTSKDLDDKKKKLLRVINKSGKQRMLSQRLTLYYTASLVFPENKLAYRNTLNKIFLEYEDAISFLSIVEFNNEATEKELEIVMEKWDKYVTDKEGFFSGSFDATEVYTTTNNLTSSFNKITNIYASLN